MYSHPLVWREKGNCTEDKYVFKLVVRSVAYVTKLTDIFEQTTTFMAACYGLALNTRLSDELCSSGEIDLYSGLVMVSLNSLPWQKV